MGSSGGLGSAVADTSTLGLRRASRICRTPYFQPPWGLTDANGRAYRPTPAAVHATRDKAGQGDRSTDIDDRGREDRVSKIGSVTLRHHGLHHIGLGRTYAVTFVRLLVEDLDIAVVDIATGELLRELVLDPSRDYQPTGRPPRPTAKNNNGPTFP
jgi:hypothetical protein